MKINSSFFLSRRRMLALLAFTLWLTQETTTFAKGASQTLTATRLQTARTYGALPLSFEKNQGQADPQEKFLSRGAGYSILLNDRAALLLLSKKNPAHLAPLRLGGRMASEQRTNDTTADVLSMELVEPSPSSVI